MRVKRAAAFLMVLILLVAMAPPGGVTVNATEENETYSFSVGASSSEMIAGGGRIVSTSNETYFLNDCDQLMCGTEVLAEGNLSCLNIVENSAFFVRKDASSVKIVKLSLDNGKETEIASIDKDSVKEMYVVNGSEFYLLTDDGIELYSNSEKSWTTLQEDKDVLSFVPTEYGVIYATGSLFHYNLHGAGRLIISDVDGYYVDEHLNGGCLVFTKAGSTYQVALMNLFSGDIVIMDFMGYGTVDALELLSDLNSPDGDFQYTQKPNSRGVVPSQAGNRKTLSSGVQNIVKRAYQMTNIQWTPLSNISGWNSEMIYYAGQTYTGLPYGQPYSSGSYVGSYVPWQTSLTDFVSAVNYADSLMYTSYANYNKKAPYYSCDCSAFVSWAWNLNSRQVTSTIPNYAILVSEETYTGLQVGDCFCSRGNHVVLVTDITYDENGAISGVEISESTVNMATNYCCQKTWYGTGNSYPLSMLQTKYIDSGYGLYRSTTRDNATYTHYCVVPLEGDVCELCGANSYTSTKTYAAVRFLSDVTIYRSPDETSEQCGTVYSDRELNITASTTIDGVVWYQLEISGWVKADQTSFEGYVKTVAISDEYLPSGRLVQGHVFPLEGIITSTNPMTGITATISTSSGAQEQEKAITLDSKTEYSLKSSAIDNAMVFNQVPLGDHVMELQITELAKCDGQNSETLTTVISCPFSVYTVSEPRTVSAHGIDVSKYQGDIDWDTVANSIDFAIIRCGYGDDQTDQDDEKWNRNVEACERLGIPYGVYIYSYALTDDQALSEAQHVIRLLAGHSPTLPVYLDLEDSGTTGTLTCAAILRHTKIFCEAIEDAGYIPGVYATTSWWSGKLASGEYNRWNRWVARFSDSLNYNGELNAWQYSESGSVSGISGNVDMDYWYGDFPDSQSTHEHTYDVTVTKDVTCTEAGIRTYTCTICGDQYMEEIPALGHAYGNWITTLQPTCTEIGEQSATCSRCGDTQHREVPAVGHTFQNGICTVCGVSDPSIKKGDINGDGVVTSADAVLLARCLVDLSVFSDVQIYRADLNGDGIVSSADAVLIAKLLTQ